MEIYESMGGISENYYTAKGNFICGSFNIKKRILGRRIILISNLSVVYAYYRIRGKLEDSMEKIGEHTALDMLKKCGNEYVIEVDSLKYIIEKKEKFECLTDGDVLIVINPSDDLDYVTVIPFSEKFDVDELISVICKKCNSVSMLVNIHKLSPDFSAYLCEKLSTKFEYERSFKDYIYASDAITQNDGHIRLLLLSDKDLFLKCSDEQIKYRPPLSVLFDVFINKHQGQILAAFEEDRIIGYLSFISISDTVYDVDYIYVIPQKRGVGVGKKLAEAYASYSVKHGHDAYWSSVQNAASEKTAISCGFTFIREARKYTSN